MYNTLWEQGIGVGMRGSGGGGGAGGMDPIGKSHVIWVDLDLNPLLPLTKFPGSAHGGGGGQFISLECIRTDFLMEDQAQTVPLHQIGTLDWLKMMVFSHGLDNTTRYLTSF